MISLPVQDAAADAEGSGARRTGRAHPLARMILGRVAAGILLGWVVSVVIFVGTEVLPGNAAYAVLGRYSTPSAVAAISAQLGLDKPAYERYFEWLGGVLHGNLGTSLTAPESVSAFMSGRLGNSLVLAAATMTVMIPLSLALGLAAGTKPGQVVDHLISDSALAIIGIPDFVVGSLLAVFFGVVLHLLPPVSLVLPGTTPLSDPAILVLPTMTLVLVGYAYMVRLVRAGMSEAMTSEYVEWARLNGIPEGRIIRKHALRNALAPTVQTTALTVQWLIGGIFVVETVFGYPGIGQGLVLAVQARDIPTVQSVGLIIAFIYIGINIVADVVVMLLIPKLRTQA
ncbi:MAG: ABC transporter permease [Streptosporangiaceae bacterium]